MSKDFPSEIAFTGTTPQEARDFLSMTRPVGRHLPPEIRDMRARAIDIISDEKKKMPETMPALLSEQKGGKYCFSSEKSIHTCTLMQGRICALLGNECLYLKDATSYAMGTLTEFPCPKIRQFYNQ